MTKAKWTYMVYIAGDNNLERFGIGDLLEMKQVGSTSEVNIVAQFDRMADKVARRYLISNNKTLPADVVGLLPETNTGDPSVLEEFVKWAAKKYKAEHYALILWNHGSGWKDDDIYEAAARLELTEALAKGNIRSLRSGKPARTLFSTSLEKLVTEAAERAILFDDSAADFLDSQEMRNVLKKVTSHLNGKIDLLGFDACLMNMVEVCYQIQDFCDYIVGSQEKEPGDGWPYDEILAELVKNPNMGVEDLAKITVDKYIDFYKNRYPKLPVTQSAVATSKLKPLADVVDKLADILRGLVDDSDTIGSLFKSLRQAQTFSDRDYIDLGDFCRQLEQTSTNKSLGKQARMVFQTLSEPDSPVVHQKSHGPSVANTTGLSIYLPTRILSPLYHGLQFAQKTKWGQFLKEFVY